LIIKMGIVWHFPAGMSLDRSAALLQNSAKGGDRGREGAGVKFRDLNNQRPTPNNQRPTPNVQRPTSNVQRPTPNVQRPTSNVQRPTSNAQRPTPQRVGHKRHNNHKTLLCLLCFLWPSKKRKEPRPAPNGAKLSDASDHNPNRNRNRTPFSTRRLRSRLGLGLRLSCVRPISKIRIADAGRDLW
jgi:hypothetical protein